jgi:hypothetical protein
MVRPSATPSAWPRNLEGQLYRAMAVSDVHPVGRHCDQLLGRRQRPSLIGLHDRAPIDALPGDAWLRQGEFIATGEGIETAFPLRERLPPIASFTCNSLAESVRHANESHGWWRLAHATQRISGVPLTGALATPRRWRGRLTLTKHPQLSRLHKRKDMAPATRELPTFGYALEVDGRPKAEFATRDGARTGGEEKALSHASDQNL